MRSTKFKTKIEKGITLIALIITIVVLLILAVVAITSIQNDSIIEYANNAVTEYKNEQQKEQTMLGSYETLLNGGVPTDLMDYILGVNRQGKSLSQLINASYQFIDEEGEVREDITTLNTGWNEDSTRLVGYIKYEEVAYKIVCKGNESNLALNVTDSIAKVYEPQGREGNVVESGTYAGWIYLTDRNGLVEIISPDTVGDPLTLGSGDTASTVELDGVTGINEKDTAILSYNNAITTINNYCKQVMGINNVRSVGGTNNSAKPYTSDNKVWGAGIKTSVPTGDMQYELDFVKLSYFGKVSTTNSYWLASRCVYEYPSDVTFDVRYVDSGTMNSDNLWDVDSSGTVRDYSPSYAVRPVVINPSDLK